jgi:hypothetical protein
MKQAPARCYGSAPTLTKARQSFDCSLTFSVVCMSPNVEARSSAAETSAMELREISKNCRRSTGEGIPGTRQLIRIPSLRPFLPRVAQRLLPSTLLPKMLQAASFRYTAR